MTRERHLSITEESSCQGAEKEANRREDVSGLTVKNKIKTFYNEGVVARQQQPVVLPVFVTSEWRHVVATFDLHHGILNRNSRGVKHLTFDP